MVIAVAYLFPDPMTIIELAAFGFQHVEVILGYIAGDFPERSGCVTPGAEERILDVQVAPVCLRRPHS